MFALGFSLQVVALVGVAVLCYREYRDAERARAEAAEWKKAYQSLVIQVRNAVKPKETVVAKEFWAPKDRYAE